jgi:hypothetical protein
MADDKALVHEVAVPGPATHVIAIGIGQYDHLPGGSARETKHHLKLGQLTTPPVSARAIASWFIEKFDCTERPLASVSLVVSEAQPAPFTNAKTGRSYLDLPSGRMDEVRAALKAWIGRAESDPRNAVILYFCGHGLAAGVQNYYLMRDYGWDDEDPLLGAINFKNFMSGLGTKKPSYQFLLFDACRSPDPMISLNRDGGQSVFVADPEGRLNVAEQMQQCPIFSTEVDRRALGRPNEPSLCAQAFMRVMNGAAARRDGADWYVTTHAIDISLSDFQNREANKGDRIQSADANNYAKFRLRRLGPQTPRIPVFVRVIDAPRRALLKITAERHGKPPLCISDPSSAGWVNQDEWVAELEMGEYDFNAVHISDANQTHTMHYFVIPTHGDVRF